MVPTGFLGTGTPPIPVKSTTQSNASPAGLAVTRDDGAHWSFVRPSGVTWNPTDHSVYVDHSTGRLFFEDFGTIPPVATFGTAPEGPANINWSADSGRTWHHVAITTVFLPENPRFAVGVAPAGQGRPHGYPHVVYFCADTNVGFTSPAIAGRLCFRSLDGGSTWRQRSVLFSDAGSYPECGNDAEEFSANDGKYPQAAPDGSLYVMVSCGGRAYLARSTDEAKTFRILHADGKAVTVPVNTPAAELRIASDGTMFIVSGPVNGATTPRTVDLYASADHGRTWTRGIDLVPPGVTTVQQWSMEIASPTELAVSFLAHRRGQKTWDGYVTGTRDLQSALSPGPGPLLWGARVNPANRPLLYGDDLEGAGQVRTPGGGYQPFGSALLHTSQGTGDEFIGATVAYDGTDWGSFTEDCGPSPTSPGCRADGDETRGYVGYLTWPSAAHVHPVVRKPTLATTGLGLGVTVGASAMLLLASLLAVAGSRRRESS